MRHETDASQYRETLFNYVLIQNTPFIGKDINSAPLAHINDGYNDMIVQQSTAGRCRLANLLIQQDGGTYFNEDGTIKNSLGLQYSKCRAWRIDPYVKAPRPLEQPIATSESAAAAMDTSSPFVGREPTTGNAQQRNNSSASEEAKSSKKVQLKQQLLERSQDEGQQHASNIVYRYDERAFFSIDGEHYPAQRIQGSVLKGALPVFY